MKRITLLIAGLFVLLGALTFIAPSSAYAQTQKQADKCRITFGGKQLTDKSSGKLTLTNFNAMGCKKSEGGNCTYKSVGNGSGTYFNVTCQKKPGKPPTAAEPEDTGCENGADCIQDPSLTCKKDNCDIVDNFVNPTIVVLTVLVGLAVTIGIIWGAIEVSMSAGDPQKSASGKNHIRNAIIALVAYIFLYAFLQWVVPGGAA